MRAITSILLTLLVLSAFALTPGKVVFQNSYPGFGEESSYNLKSSFTYGVDTQIECRAYFPMRFDQLRAEALSMYPGSSYAGVYHLIDIELDPGADFGHEDNQWWLEVEAPDDDWNQSGGYPILPNEDFGDDVYGFETDLNYYGDEGVSGTHTVTYSVVIELVDDWDSYLGEYVWQTDVTISVGSFEWTVP